MMPMRNVMTYDAQPGWATQRTCLNKHQVPNLAMRLLLKQRFCSHTECALLLAAFRERLCHDTAFPEARETSCPQLWDTPATIHRPQRWTVVWMWYPYSCGQWYGYATLTAVDSGCGTLTVVDSGMDVLPLQLWTVDVAPLQLWTDVWMWHPYSRGQWYGCATLTAVDSAMDVVPLQLWTVLWLWHPYSCGQWMWHPYSCGQWYGCGPLTAMDSGMDVVPLQLWTVVCMWHPYSCGQWYGCGNLTVVDSGMDVASLQLWTALGRAPLRCYRPQRREE